MVTACPGSASCAKGLANTQATAEKIRQILSGRRSLDVRINISGCPNNCVHSAVADIGLVGLRRKQEGKMTECYRLFTGGGNGRNNKLAEQCDIIHAHDVSTTIKCLLNGTKPPNARPCKKSLSTRQPGIIIYVTKT